MGEETDSDRPATLKPKRKRKLFENFETSATDGSSILSESGPQKKKRKQYTTKMKQHGQQIRKSEIASVVRDQLYPDGQLKASSFKAMSALLKECMLGHRWDEANQILTAMCWYQSQETDYQWKCGVHILQNHPEGSPELVEKLFSVVSKVKLISQNKLKLEHALYLLSQNRIEDAYNALDTKTLANYGLQTKHNVESEKVWKELTVAYTGLIEYYQWSRSTLPNEEDEHHASTSAKTARKDRDRALTNLGRICLEPGVWDIFITRQVEILESQGNIQEAVKVLRKYREDNRTNPNAHVYLYNFMKRHRSHNTNKLRKILKKLIKVLPADRYTLEYVTLLEETNEATARNVLPVLFNMADLSSCHSNIELWKLLVKHVLLVFDRQAKEEKKILRDCWTSRKSWWPSFHFGKTQVVSLVRQHYKAALQKAILASVFFGSGHAFVQKVHNTLEATHQKSAHKLNRHMLRLVKPLG